MNKPIILKTLDALSPEVVSHNSQVAGTGSHANTKPDSRPVPEPDAHRPSGRIVMPPAAFHTEPTYRHWGINE
jgi:hypothetical protein